VEQTFAGIQAELRRETGRDPPLMHTPHSMFSMLCDVFEQEFPNSMPRQAVEDMLLRLQTSHDGVA
jgi:hypothetical protein